MIRPITTWYRLKEGEWTYNHFEFGINDNDSPTPESDQQQCWESLEWQKKYGFYQHSLGRNRVVEETGFAPKPNNA
jgi:hypothetical protein